MHAINRRDRSRTERTPPPVVLKQLSGAERVNGARSSPTVDGVTTFPDPTAHCSSEIPPDPNQAVGSGLREDVP